MCVGGCIFVRKKHMPRCEYGTQRIILESPSSIHHVDGLQDFRFGDKFLLMGPLCQLQAWNSCCFIIFLSDQRECFGLVLDSF